MADKVWEDRGMEILLSTVIIGVLSTLILIWRVTYGILGQRKLLVCDYLLIIASILNVATIALRFKTTQYGLGRHIADPSIIKPDHIMKYSYYLYCSQVINLIAMAVLKFSICAYLLVLKFSKVYTAVVWLSIVMVTVFNFLTPFMGVMNCTPFRANWDRSITNKKCWYKGTQGLTYMQGVSNCVTDIVYVVAPLLYLRTVQLPRRTQWGLRCVFLLGLVATVCSVFKTIELDALQKTRDPTWDGVDLTIWSATELSVGILIASLPPLRKQFDKFFRYVLPSTLQSRSKSRTPGNSIPLYNVSRSRHTNKPKDPTEDDEGSERFILPAESPSDRSITKTVVHEVKSEIDQSHSDHFHSEPKYPS